MRRAPELGIQAPNGFDRVNGYGVALTFQLTAWPGWMAEPVAERDTWPRRRTPGLPQYRRARLTFEPCQYREDRSEGDRQHIESKLELDERPVERVALSDRNKSEAASRYDRKGNEDACTEQERCFHQHQICTPILSAPLRGSLTGRCGLGRLIRRAPEAIAPPHPPISLNRLTGRCGLPEQVEGEHVDAVPAGQPTVHNSAEVGFVACKAKSYRIL